ncbi:flagellar hook-basal body complex protein FliE [Caminibacter mediatlanticus TB-2]|uniref:Flagellar hook-basal body complex protein FliE n=1 Tax=Caminibacter mediatlanticus TB-2 TaxID=391592 RepID=A0AAI9AGJ9_9BACT|nr:flagellar hook-basal body complex protein FliE [Caminibacter mediatlanticus]EDM23215.1 flagellar hook-basal body protein FliE [Caminibacter mediatlanticus TB-2]QCT93905.1 flagellar hook-basal body complex protein FliE [Caminibacter mediatlanticus TB-2]
MAFINKVDNNLNNLTSINKQQKNNNELNFSDVLKKELNETNNLMQKAEKASADIASGEVQDLAKASITIQKAEMKMKMMLEVRNKAINAYKELLKTQI